MKKIILIIYLLNILLLYAYEPIPSTEDLYMRDIPIFTGLEETLERLKSGNDQPVWALNLSGGSARAFAHIGVLKRLEEEGIRPDVIITNSMGSIVGIAYAAGMSITDIEDMVKTLKLSEFFELIFPRKGGFIDLHQFEALMTAIFEEMDISETAIPVFVVCEDLKTKRQVILSKGNLVEVLKASFALPFYFEPVNIENFRLVDGGTSSLVPIRAFKDILPVMVVSSTFYDADINLKNPLTVLNVTMDISKSRRAINQIKEYNSFLIRCDVEDISFMAFDEGDRIIKKGYESSSKVLTDLIGYLNERDINPVNKNPEIFSSTKIIHDNWLSLKTNLNQIPLPVKNPGWAFKPSLEVWHSFRNPHYLNQNYFPIIKTSAWFKRNLIEAMVFYTGNITGSILKMNFGINNFLYINTDSQITFSISNENIIAYKENYFFTQTGFIIPVFRSFLEPGIIGEFLNIEDPEKLKYYIRPGVNLVSENSNFLLDLRYLIRKEAGITTLGISAEHLTSTALSSNFGLDTRAYLKAALNNRNIGLELNFNDYFRNTRSSILSNTNEYMPSYLIINTNINWNVGKYLSTLGEIITLNNSKMYLFSDLLLKDIFDDIEPHATMGFGLNLETSLIGLKPYIFNFSTGWDIEAKAAFITFNMKTIIN
jgi:predicted acylesterase/phospholipase RssA